LLVHTHQSKVGFGAGLTPIPLRWGLKYYKLKGTFSKTVYKTKDVQQVAN